MFDNYLVRSNSLRNVVAGGETVGFSIAVRIANYRGVFLSLHTGYFIEVDAVSYPVADQSSFEVIKTAVWEHWDFDDEAILHVRKPGGLSPGEHVLRFQQCVIAGYGYLPTDVDWVKASPVPGTGAGSDKTPQVVTYRVFLNESKEEGR
jgi:hypothetical protein